MLHISGLKAYDSRIWGKIGASWISGLSRFRVLLGVAFWVVFFNNLGLRGSHKGALRRSLKFLTAPPLSKNLGREM